MTTAIHAAMQELRAEIEKRTAALAALERVAGPYGTMIEVQALTPPAPAGARARREAAPPPPAAEPARRRGGTQIDPDVVRRLHAEGLNDRQIAERIGGVSGSAVRLHRIKLGLPIAAAEPAAEPAADAAVAEPLQAREIVRWLREVNVTVDIVERGKRWRLNGRTVVDGAALLVFANTRRERMGQPPFSLAD